MPEVTHELSDDDSFKTANLITMMRIYDVLMGIYSNINPEEANSMVKLHERGLFATPPPAFLAAE